MPFCELDVISNQLMEWTIDPQILGGPGQKGNTIYSALFDQVEYAGRFTMHYEIKKQCRFEECTLVPTQSSTIDKFNKGSATSVKTSDGYCNYHTHPFSCYAGERTMWGWPSGEDMREVIGFMLRNNLFHLVFTLEGIYLIQVNPNFLSILLDNKKLGQAIDVTKYKNAAMETKNKNNKYNQNGKIFLHPDRVRGIVISLIESYFKATHGHRGIDYNNSIRKSVNTKSKDTLTSRYWGVCMPEDWVEFSNKFKLSNMNNVGNNKCTKALPCNCFPDYEDMKGSLSLPDYLRAYGIDIYDLSTKGKICDVSIVQGKGGKEDFEDLYYSIIEDNFDTIINLFEGNDVSTDLSYGGEQWDKGQWFRVQLFYNEFQCNSTIPEYSSFEDWMHTCIEKEGQHNMPLPQLVHQFWERCNQTKSGFRFSPTNPATVMFKALKPPKGKTSCDVRHGDDIHRWIFSITGQPTQFSTTKKRKKTKKTTKRKKTKKTTKRKNSRFGKVEETKGRKKILSFGLNPHKR